MQYVPNIITIGRLLATPLAVWLILTGEIDLAFWVFVAAGISDAADGFIAKQFNLETEFGKFLDPIADKALLVSVFMSLGHEGHLATWLVILVVFRDALIVGGALIFQTVTHELTMEPLMVSKANTVAQMLLAAMVLGLGGNGIDDGGLIDVMIVVTAATTVVSGAAYVIKWTRRAAEVEGRE